MHIWQLLAAVAILALLIWLIWICPLFAKIPPFGEVLKWFCIAVVVIIFAVWLDRWAGVGMLALEGWGGLTLRSLT